MLVRELHKVITFFILHGFKMYNPNKKEQEIVNQFTKDNNLMVSYCESCRGWYVHCPACDTRVCTYIKFCCCNATMFQDKLDKLLEQVSGGDE